MKYKALIILFLVILLGHGHVMAADVDVSKNRGPVSVSSDKMVADDLAKTLVFEGNAVATQDDVTIYADRLTITYKGEERKIQQVVAEGSARIVQGSRVATGDKAILFHTEQRIVLTGTPEVRDGDNFVKGDEITLYLNDQRSVVTGGNSGRVNAVFTPKTEGKP